MIVFLDGILESKSIAQNSATIVINVCGVGYEVFIPLSTYDSLPREGANYRILTHDHVREDARILFGFASQLEKDMFLMLQDVSGIGPKTALGALSAMPVRQLRKVIADSEVKVLSKLPGIGKKTAERIIVELKGKINPLEAASVAEGEQPLSQAFSDAVAALVTLGQPQDIAIKAVRKVAESHGSKELSTQDIIRKALSAR